MRVYYVFKSPAVINFQAVPRWHIKADLQDGLPSIPIGTFKSKSEAIKVARVLAGWRGRVVESVPPVPAAAA